MSDDDLFHGHFKEKAVREEYEAYLDAQTAPPSDGKPPGAGKDTLSNMAEIPDDVKAKAKAAVMDAHSKNKPPAQSAPALNPDTRMGQEAEKAQTVHYRPPTPEPKQPDQPDKG